MAAWRAERLAMAQEAFERAIELFGKRPALLSDYAWFMATERGPKLGKEAAEAAIEADADSSTAWAALGLAQFRLHRRAEAEASLRRALELNPNDIYAQSAMVTLLQDRHEDSKAEALAGLLEEHAGAEDLVAAVRDEAKRRRIGRMLVERKVDVDAPPRQPRSTLLGLGAGRRNAHRPAVLVLRSDVFAHRSRGRGRLGGRAVQTVRLGANRLHRCFQALLIFSTAALSWLLMLAVHESGHVLQGWLSGAKLDAVHLPLFGFSRTDFAVNPHPLFVAWGGACGAAFCRWRFFIAARCFAAKRHVYLLAWFAGFCLIANGAYLLGGAILTGGADDGGVILQHGGARWQLSASASSPWPPACIFGTASAPISALDRAAGKSIARPPSA